MVDEKKKNENQNFFFVMCLHTTRAPSGGRGTREHGEKERGGDRQTERDFYCEWWFSTLSFFLSEQREEEEERQKKRIREKF